MIGTVAVLREFVLQLEKIIYLLLRKSHVNPAAGINKRRCAGEIDYHEFLYIQPEKVVYRVHAEGNSADRICGIYPVPPVTFYRNVGITEEGNQLDLLCPLVERSNDYRVAAPALLLNIARVGSENENVLDIRILLVDLIDTGNPDRRVSGVSRLRVIRLGNGRFGRAGRIGTVRIIRPGRIGVKGGFRRAGIGLVRSCHYRNVHVAFSVRLIQRHQHRNCRADKHNKHKQYGSEPYPYLFRSDAASVGTASGFVHVHHNTS